MSMLMWTMQDNGYENMRYFNKLAIQLSYKL